MTIRSHFLGLALGLAVGSLSTAVILSRTVADPAPSRVATRATPEESAVGRAIASSREGRPDLRSQISAALESREDRKALALLRALLAEKELDPSAIATFLAEILGKTAENSFFRRHFESVFDEADFFPILRRTLELAGLPSAVRRVLLRTLSESGNSEIDNYLLERVRTARNVDELADLIELAKYGPAFQEELTRLFLDLSRPRDARVAAANRLARSRASEAEKLLTQALTTEQDPSVLLALAGAGVGWGTPALRDALLGLFQDYSKVTKDRQQALDYLLATQDPSFESLVAKTANSDPDPEIRAQAAIELLHFQPPVAGMFIQQIVPGSQAQGLGLRRGDILLQYNGQSFTSLNALANAVQQTSSQDQIALRVFRGGQVLDLIAKGGRIGISADYVTPR